MAYDPKFDGGLFDGGLFDEFLFDESPAEEAKLFSTEDTC